MQPVGNRISRNAETLLGGVIGWVVYERGGYWGVREECGMGHTSRCPALIPHDRLFLDVQT